MAVAGAAKRYAQAAFDIAEEQGTLEQWERDLQYLLTQVSDPSVGEFLASPAVPEEAKQRAIEQILPEDDQRQVRNLALVLLERGRFDQLPQVVEVFQDLLLEARGIAIAEVTTAVELAPAEVQRITEQLSRIIGKEIQLQPRVDPEIIGGVIARVGDSLIDGSVRTQLATMRRRLVT